MDSRSKIEILVWYEMVHAKFWEQYISDYSGNRATWKKWFGLAVAATAVFGGSTWSMWRVLNAEWVTPLTFGVMGIVQVLVAIQKDIVVDTATLQSIFKLRSMYIEYFNKIERLFLSREEGGITLDELEESYFSLRDTTMSIENLKDSLNIKKKKRIAAKVDAKVKEYLSKRYFSSPEEAPKVHLL